MYCNSSSGGRDSAYVRFEEYQMQRRGKAQTREMGTQTVNTGEGERSRESVEGEMEMRVGSPSRNFSRIIPSPPPASSRGRQRETGGTTFADGLDGFESARWRMESSFSPQGRRGERRERYRFLDQRIPSGDLHAL